MISTGSKFFFALAAFGLVGAMGYGAATDGGALGIVTLGLKGGVGELLGYWLFVMLAVVGLFLGLLTVVFRDADPDLGPSVADAEAIATGPQASASPWPIVAAFAVAMLLLGVAFNEVFFVLGLIAVGIVIVEWMVQGWADRASTDADFNRSLRNRMMLPFEIPAIAVIAIAVGVLAFSRVLLALPKLGSTYLSIGVAVSILAIAFLVASRPRISGNLVAAVLLAGGLLVIGGGIIAAAVGEREFEHHGEEDEGDAEESSEVHEEEGALSVVVR
ncbi:MAG: hypothetical protein ACRDJP_05580 [Actinomycetota bacterium]